VLLLAPAGRGGLAGPIWASLSHLGVYTRVYIDLVWLGGVRGAPIAARGHGPLSDKFTKPPDGWSHGPERSAGVDVHGQDGRRVPRERLGIRHARHGRGHARHVDHSHGMEVRDFPLMISVLEEVVLFSLLPL
jgi:hypothetical protein